MIDPQQGTNHEMMEYESCTILNCENTRWCTM